MSFNKNDNKDMAKHLESNSWSKNKNSDGYSKNGKTIHPSESGQSWTGTAGTFTSPGDARKSDRLK